MRRGGGDAGGAVVILGRFFCGKWLWIGNLFVNLWVKIFLRIICYENDFGDMCRGHRFGAGGG